tara:strand:- start:687 stop:824 length:138 start_codon:yes stop_codon:yes gene_type:complete
MRKKNKTQMGTRRKNKAGNFRGKEDEFFTKVRNGLKKFLEPAWKS